MSATWRVAIWVWSRSMSACRSGLLKAIQELAEALRGALVHVGELDPVVRRRGHALHAAADTHGWTLPAQREMQLQGLAHGQWHRDVHEDPGQAQVQGEGGLG